MIQTIGVIVFRDKAYIPTDSQTPSGIYLAMEPVFTAELNVEELAKAMQCAIAQGNPVIPSIHHREYRKIDPVLKATGARNWKRLAREGASYGVFWRDEKIDLYMSMLDHKGRFVNDPDKTLRFDRDIEIEEIAQAILSDWESRSLS